jgi:hypothetical protein
MEYLLQQIVGICAVFSLCFVPNNLCHDLLEAGMVGPVSMPDRNLRWEDLTKV